MADGSNFSCVVGDAKLGNEQDGECRKGIPVFDIIWVEVATQQE